MWTAGPLYLTFSEYFSDLQKKQIIKLYNLLDLKKIQLFRYLQRIKTWICCDSAADDLIVDFRKKFSFCLHNAQVVLCVGE